MATGWGNKTWGASEWGDLSNAFVDASSVAATFTVGSVSIEADANQNLTGIEATSNIGSVGIEIAVEPPITGIEVTSSTGQAVSGIGVNATGSSATGSLGSPIIDAETGQGWGGDTWGENAWGELNSVFLDVTGIALSSLIGNETPEANANVTPSGLSLTSTNGGTDAFPVSIIEVSGINLSSNIGNSTYGFGVDATGSEITSSISSVTIDDQFLIGEGWGRDSWGNLGWGVNYTVIGGGVNGIGLTSSIGNEDAFTDVTVTVSGIELQSAITPVGTSANSDNEIAHSFLIQSSLGDTSITGHALVEPSGIAATSAIGDAVGGTIQEVPVTGSQVQTFIGNEDTEANAKAFPNGIELTGSVGDIVPISEYSATGSEATVSVGDVTLVGNANVQPTGIGLTIEVASPNIIAWAEVDVGTPVTWTEVDLAA